MDKESYYGGPQGKHLLVSFHILVYLVVNVFLLLIKLTNSRGKESRNFSHTYKNWRQIRPHCAGITKGSTADQKESGEISIGPLSVRTSS